MVLAKNIRYLRQVNNMSQEELSEKLGRKSYTTVTKWETGISEPPLKVVAQLSKIFGVDMNDLTTVDLELAGRSKTFESSNGVLINVFSCVGAGYPGIIADENIVDQEEIDKSLAATGDFFGLKIHGDSMQPRICDGDTVIVRRQSTADEGQIVIALVNGNEGVCKKLSKHSDGLSLISLNPAYPPLYFTKREIESEPVRILGVVKELRAKF